MLLPHLMRAIESNAEGLTRDVMEQLRADPRVAYLHRVSDEELLRRVQDLYGDLGKWLTTRNDAEVRRVYRGLGARRQREGVPVSELVHALTAVKRRVWDFVRSNAAESSVEVYQEDELFHLLNAFFDEAIYQAVVGHERAARGWEIGIEERVAAR